MSNLIEQNSDDVKWTDEQREAFEDRNHNLLVSASAGSGKTTVMIKRIVDLVLEDRIPISNFLVVTFTKASAGDMKKKLIDAFLKKQNDSFAIEQIENVETSDISNLHSFCSRLISTYFYEVGIDPAYHIIDDGESTFLKDRALTKLFEQKEKTGDVEFFELFDIFQKKRSDKQLKEIIKRFCNFLNSHIDGKKWFEESLKATHALNLNENISANLINTYVSNSASKDAKKAEDMAELCLNFGQEKLYDYFMDVSSLLKTIKKKNPYMVNAKNVFDINFGRKPVVDKKKEGYEHISEISSALNDELKDNLENYRENFVSNDEKIILEGLQSSKQRLIALFNLVQEFNEIYSSLKKESNGLDFNDLEKYALQILSNEAILQGVKQKYKYVFVDEYQDINNVQEKIISLVSGENNRFMVGDVKQSIYRFRLCDPDIFLQKYDLYGKGGEFNKLIKLNCNFRSDKKILSFVDEVFSGVMTEDFGGVNYKNDAHFVAGENNLDKPDSVNLCYIDTQKEKQEKPAVSGVYSVKNHVQEDSEEVKSAVAEAKYVASKIADLTNKSNLDSIDYADIAILVGARNEAISKFVETLEAFGIPVSSDEKHNLMEEWYVQELVNFVKLMCNRKDDFVLFKVLKSRLFNFTDEEIVSLRKIDLNARFFDVVEMFEQCDDEILKNKMHNFMQKIDMFSKFAKILSLKELIYKIIDEFCLAKLNYFMQNGEQINNNVDKFINALPEVDAFEFVINYANFELVVENECGGDAVKLMTIHKSKGIEFKAVFLVNTSNAFNFMSTRGAILFNKYYGVGMDYFDLVSRAEISTIPISAIRLLERRKLVEEQQRVWYVALTRAVQKMFLVCSKPLNRLNKNFPDRPTCFANWLEPIIVKELEGKHNELIKFETYQLNDLVENVEKQEKQLLFNDADIDKPDWFDYEYKNSLNIPLKNSVSKILKNNELFENEYENSLVYENTKSSADRGTLYHKVFQNINLKKIEEIDSQFDLIKNLFTENEWQNIDDNLVKNVLKLPFFKEIQQNDIIFKEREFYAKMPANLLESSAPNEDEFIMQGVIDLLIVKPDGLWILDYKTGTLNDEKLEKYKFQLETYANAVERAFGKNVTKKFLCTIDLQKILEI